MKLSLKEINEKYYYSGDDLGYTRIGDTHIFKVWSPMAESMELCIYNEYNNHKNLIYSMYRKEKGVWEVEINNLEGKYYTFISTIEGKRKEAVDPYAKALSVNGEKGALIDMNETNPEGFKEAQGPRLDNATDAIIYEIHTRDLSIDENSGISFKGKFLGLAQEDTVGINNTKTGISHIKDLGVTHVQLLPIYDYGSLDERDFKMDSQKENELPYNWGYDPKNYNSTEGTYATNPYEPITRIKELKIAIEKFHENGLGVIMDVVYNHMYDVEASSFNKLMPGYFFRYDEEGNLCDESCCGNAVASENPMVRKFIVDSVKHWAKEYKLDGFRFDLMGLIDVETMNEIKREVEKINPSIIILGEGWNMGATLKDEEKAIQPNAYKMKNIAFFNDDIRDALRGSCFDDHAKGFLSGESGFETRVKKGVVGAINYSNEIQTWGEVEPNQVVNYIECHDNNTLFDKLKMQLDHEKKIKDMHRLGDSIVLLSQGIPFIHGGQEFLRTKQGIENSYRSHDAINKMDWKRKYENMDTVEYIKGLIELRKAHEEFRMRTSEDIRHKIKFMNSPENSVVYTIDGHKEESPKILVVHNANEEDITLNFDGKLKVIVDKYNAGTEVLREVKGSNVEVQGISTLVAYMV